MAVSALNCCIKSCGEQESPQSVNINRNKRRYKNAMDFYCIIHTVS